MCVLAAQISRWIVVEVPGGLISPSDDPDARGGGGVYIFMFLNIKRHQILAIITRAIIIINDYRDSVNG